MGSLPPPRKDKTRCHKLCHRYKPQVWGDGRRVNGCPAFNAYEDDIEWRSDEAMEMKLNSCGHFELNEDSLDVIVGLGGA